jgi:prepilin-type N-terminal cleavage/methylation domain-containing protein
MNTMRNQQSGFTLVETLIAIFILALTIGALLTLTAGGFFSIRYAKNDIVASNLLQESLEFIRNSRDSAAQRDITWDQWKQQFATCFDDTGCVINPYAPEDTLDFVASCNENRVRGGANDCSPLIYLQDQGLYVQGDLASVFETTGIDIQTSFIRNIFFEDITTTPTNPQLRVSARMDWKNGTNPKNLTQSIILTPWNINQ